MKSRKVNNFNVGNYYKVTLEEITSFGDIIKITRSDHHERFYTTVFCASNKPDYFHIDSGTGNFHINSTFAEYLVPCTHKLVVLQNGNKTIAKHYVDGKLLEEEVAKCHPDDDYNFATGTKIAIDRLFESTDIPIPSESNVSEHKRNTLDWDKFLNGEIFVQVTRKTVDDFLNVCETKGLRWASHHSATKWNPFENYDNALDLAKARFNITDMDPVDNAWIRIVNGNITYRHYAPEDGSEIFVWENSFDWEKFEDGKLCVKLTKETEMDFLKECDKRGYRWRDTGSTTRFVPVFEEYFVMSVGYEKLLVWNMTPNGYKDVVVW